MQGMGPQGMGMHGMGPHSLGNVIARGEGKGTKAMIGWLLYNLGGAVVSFILAGTVGITRYTLFGRTLHSEANAFFYLFLIIGIAEIVLAILTALAVSNTRIEAREGGVVGKGISKWFYFGDIRSFEFMIPYDQINVDFKGEQMVVHSGSTHYKVYVKNAPELQQAIFSRKTHRG